MPPRGQFGAGTAVTAQLCAIAGKRIVPETSVTLSHKTVPRVDSMHPASVNAKSKEDRVCWLAENGTWPANSS